MRRPNWRRLKTIRPPLDTSDALAIAGVGAIAYTVHLLWPVWVYAFVGVCLLITWALREVTHGTARPRR